MTPWRERPPELAHLFNPAFCGLLIRWVVDAHVQAGSGRSLPFELSFVALPLLLPDSIRNRLPRTTQTHLDLWLQRNPEISVAFPEVLRDLIPYTREALMLMLRTDLLAFDGEGQLQPGSRRLRLPRSGEWDPLRDLNRPASFVGRWLAAARDPVALYAVLGVRP